MLEDMAEFPLERLDDALGGFPLAGLLECFNLWNEPFAETGRQTERFSRGPTPPAEVGGCGEQQRNDDYVQTRRMLQVLHCAGNEPLPIGAVERRSLAHRAQPLAVGVRDRARLSLVATRRRVRRHAR